MCQNVSENKKAVKSMMVAKLQSKVHIETQEYKTCRME